MNIKLYPDDASRKQHATEVLASLSFLFKDPENRMGLFCSDLVVSTISSYYGQIHGATDIHDVCVSMYFCDEWPVGAIALSLATISFCVIHFHVC